MDYKILIADDEPEIRNLLRLYLENENYHVIEAEDGQRALDLLRAEQPALCILDIMMPKIDGYHVLQQIRKESNIPVIILSAKDADSEKILGLNLGADDYLAKPFNPLEAVARVNSNIRRFYSLGTKVVQEGYLSVRDLVLNQDACTLKKGDKIIQLTSVEYRIMELLSIRAKSLQNSRFMSMDGAKSISWQTIISWSASVSCGQSWMMIHPLIYRQSVVWDIAWRSK